MIMAGAFNASVNGSRVLLLILLPLRGGEIERGNYVENERMEEADGSSLLLTPPLKSF